MIAKGDPHEDDGDTSDITNQNAVVAIAVVSIVNTGLHVENSLADHAPRAAQAVHRERGDRVVDFHLAGCSTKVRVTDSFVFHKDHRHAPGL